MRKQLLGLGSLALLISGCGSSDDFDTAMLDRINRIELIDPTPNSSDDPASFRIRGFDANGNQIFGPIERDYNPQLQVSGFPNATREIQVSHQRASGHSRLVVKHPVDFLSDEDGIVSFQSHSPLGVATLGDTFTVRLVNNSAYSDDQVFISVNGKNREESGFYYLQFGSNGSAQSVPFGPVAQWDQYSARLSDMEKEEAPHTYSFQCPYQNLVSGRIYLSFGKKLQGLGLNNPADPLSLQLPSSSGAPDYLTLYEFMELSATIPPVGKGPQEYTLFANTSVVDFFSMGLGMTMAYQDTNSETSQTVGFVEGGRDKVLQEFSQASVPDVFKRYVRNQDGSQILRVLGPNQSVALDGENSAIGQFLQSAIDAGWTHYTSNVLNIPDNLPSATYGYQFVGQLIGGDLHLPLTLTAKPAGDTSSPDGEQYRLPKPTSKIVFFCDDELGGRPVNETFSNLGSDGHKRLVSLIGAALNRGVFENYSDWGNASAFFTRPDGKYNWYAKIMHQFAIDGKVYGFGYDDVYGQDPTLARRLDDVNRLVITIPPVGKLTTP